MGIDTHSLNLLRYATKEHGALGNTITLGRLTVLLGPKASRKWIGTRNSAYCEPLLAEKFGATHVDSIDNSAYEGATIVADMNQPISKTFTNRYDTVLDFGCTEHIFDVAQSLRNVAALCKPGGMILHAVPTNGFCGHGFYQFSAELFFSWYSAANGYADTEIYLADLLDTNNWYRVSAPQDGKRINVRSYGELYVLVVTRRVANVERQIQQSDYAFTWSQPNAEPAQPHSSGSFARVTEFLSQRKLIARWIYQLDSMIAGDGAKPLHRHRALTRVPISSI